MEIRLQEDDSLVMRVRDISINQPVEERLRSFPAADRLPGELEVRRISATNMEGFAAQATALFHLTPVIAANAALQGRPQLRAALGEVDWERAARTNRAVGPALRALLKISVEKEEGAAR